MEINDVKTGSDLKKWRKSMGIIQKKMAADLGRSVSYISHLENERYEKKELPRKLQNLLIKKYHIEKPKPEIVEKIVEKHVKVNVPIRDDLQKAMRSFKNLNPEITFNTEEYIIELLSIDPKKIGDKATIKYIKFLNKTLRNLVEIRGTAFKNRSDKSDGKKFIENNLKEISNATNKFYNEIPANK